MKKLLFAFSLVTFLLFFGQNVFAADSFCLLYFTYIGCPNCAVTDPLVLSEWPKKYPNLVVIEYGWRGGDWQDPNSQFFGEYAKEYKTQAAVPQIIINKNNIRLGRIDVPEAEIDIKTGKPNPCPLIDKSIYFEEVDLNDFPARPKIWANRRVLIKLDEGSWLFQWNGKNPPRTPSKERLNQTEVKELLFTENIPEKLENKIFEIVEPEKVLFSGIAFPGSDFIPYQDFENAIKINISEKVGVIEPEKEIKPEEEIGPKEEIEPGEEAAREEKESIPKEFPESEIDIPLFGKLKSERLSLPALTFLLGIADGFNPCAFFVLTFLLAALIGLAGARKKIFLVGGIFIFFSALFYFLFMSVLLNVFQLAEKIVFLTFIAGAIAVFAGIINIKDYFAFQKGISLTLPKGHKAKFMEKVKNLSLAKSTIALIITTIVIAATVNIYELLCTVGFPMIFVRILTLKELPSLQYYLYLLFYNLVYVIPLAVIVLIFAITLGRKTFSQIWVRRLKLISGFMILSLGLILIIEPALLESISTAFLVMSLSVFLGGMIIFIWNRLKKE